jgi:hypothetical protein
MCGVGLQRLLADPLWLRRFNYLMAGLLILSMVPVILDFLN